MAAATTHGVPYYLAWLVGFLCIIYLVGFVAGAAVFVFCFSTFEAKASLKTRAGLVVGTVAALLALAWILGVRYPQGLLF